jgi:putative hydrolase
MRNKPVFSRFSELDSDRLNVEFQVHTVQTDGEATIEEILEFSRERGIGALAFTEHVRIDTAWFSNFALDIRQRALRFPEMEIYVGCETKAMDVHGTLDISQSILEACDIVLGSVHRFPDGEGGFLDFKALSASQIAEIEFRLAIGMVRNAPIDVLAHPGGMYERRHGAFPEKYFRDLMIATLERGIAIEINSSYLVDAEKFIRLCREINPIVSIGSDAHKLHELGKCRDLLRAMKVGRT